MLETAWKQVEKADHVTHIVVYCEVLEPSKRCEIGPVLLKLTCTLHRHEYIMTGTTQTWHYICGPQPLAAIQMLGAFE